MPLKIPEYQVTTQTPDPATIPAPTAHAAPVAPPADLSGFVRGLGVAADAAQRSAEANGKAWAAEQDAKARLDWTQELKTRQESAAPGAPEFSPTLLKDYDAYADKLINNAPDTVSRTYLHKRLQTLRYELGDKAILWEAQARKDYRVDRYNSGIDITRKLMNTDPTQYKPALEGQLALIDNSDLDPITKSTIREKAVNGISEAAVWSQIQKSPTAFLQSIGIGTDGKARKSSGDLQGTTGNDAFDALPFDKRGQMFDQAIRLKAQLDSDADRAAEKMRKVISDDAAKSLWAAKADGKLNRSMIEQARPVLSVDEYRSFLKVATGEDGPQKSDPGTYRQLQTLIANGQLDEARSFAFRSHQNGLLSNPDLSSVVDKVRSEGRQEGPKSPYERSRAYIVGALDPGPLVHDPVGRNRLQDALEEFDNRYNALPQDQRTADNLQKMHHEIANRYKLVVMNDSAAALPLPRSGAIPRNVQDPGFDLAVTNAAMEAQRRLDAGVYNQLEYQNEMALLNKWRKLKAPKK